MAIALFTRLNNNIKKQLQETSRPVAAVCPPPDDGSSREETTPF
jgi:hypothetical protein